MLVLFSAICSIIRHFKLMSLHLGNVLVCTYFLILYAGSMDRPRGYKKEYSLKLKIKRNFWLCLCLTSHQQLRSYGDEATA